MFDWRSELEEIDLIRCNFCNERHPLSERCNCHEEKVYFAGLLARIEKGGRVSRIEKLALAVYDSLE